MPHLKYTVFFVNYASPHRYQHLLSLSYISRVLEAARPTTSVSIIWSQKNASNRNKYMHVCLLLCVCVWTWEHQMWFEFCTIMRTSENINASVNTPYTCIIENDAITLMMYQPWLSKCKFWRVPGVRWSIIFIAIWWTEIYTLFE